MMMAIVFQLRVVTETPRCFSSLFRYPIVRIARLYVPKANLPWTAIILTSQSLPGGRLRGRGGKTLGRLANTLTKRTMSGPAVLKRVAGCQVNEVAPGTDHDVGAERQPPD